MSDFISTSKEETISFAKEFAKGLQNGTLILFTGGLGVGKTAFCEGIALGLDCAQRVSSPTFSIVNVYQGTKTFAHFDLYRIHTKADLEIAGFYDYLDSGAIVAAEWSENFQTLFEKERAIHIHIEQLDEQTRHIRVEDSYEIACH